MASKQDKSNCLLCEVETNSNKDKICKLRKMNVDYVTAWSKGGTADISNCKMLCQTMYNIMKGNR